MASGYFRVYQQIEGVQDGKASDFVKTKTWWCCHLE